PEEGTAVAVEAAVLVVRAWSEPGRFDPCAAFGGSSTEFQEVHAARRGAPAGRASLLLREVPSADDLRTTDARRDERGTCGGAEEAFGSPALPEDRRRREHDSYRACPGAAQDRLGSARERCVGAAPAYHATLSARRSGAFTDGGVGAEADGDGAVLDQHTATGGAEQGTVVSYPPRFCIDRDMRAG